MNWQQKAEALQKLSEISIKTRGIDDWYISQNVEIKNGSVLESLYGNGTSPVDALNKHWEILTNLEPGQYLVIRAMSENRQAVKWNGFMWETVVEKPAVM